MSGDGWGFADMYSMDAGEEKQTRDLADIQSDDWRNILVLGRATGRSVYPETLALIGHARYLADGLGCRVEVLLIGEDLDGATEVVKQYAVDNVYRVKAPDYAPIEHTAKVLEHVVRKRRPELVLVFQSRSGDAITAYAASRLGTGFVIGASKVEIDTSERRAVVTHEGSDPRFRVVSRMTQTPQFASVQRGLFRAPMEDPYSTTNVYDLDLDVGSVATVTVKQQHPAPARTLQTAERIVVAGARIRDADDLQAAKDLAERLDGVFGVTRAVVDRGLADGPVVGRIDEHVAPKLLVCVGCTGSLEFLDAVDSEPTLVAVGSGDEDPINDRCAYRVAGTVKEAVKEILSGL